METSGQEARQCLPVRCANAATCDMEYHQCEEDICKCLPTHFDPTTAKCYKFGLTKGKPASELLDENSSTTNNSIANTNSRDNYDNNNIYKTLKDLMENGDKMWLVLIILISLSLIIFVLIFILLRKYYLGYCWTAHKKEYEPNNKTAPKNGYFSKNSINNKSFRQKSSGEVDDLEADNSSADRSSLVRASNGDKTNNKSRSVFSNKPATGTNDYVKVDMDNRASNFGPLSTSTSTPV